MSPADVRVFGTVVVDVHLDDHAIRFRCPPDTSTLVLSSPLSERALFGVDTNVTEKILWELVDGFVRGR